MLTGQIPAGHFEPPSRKVEVDVRVDEVVLRSLAREPERRYQRASDVGTEVESISRCSDVPHETHRDAKHCEPSAVEQDRGPVATAFSRKAILAICWAPLIIGVPLAFAPSRVGSAGPEWPMPWQWPLIFSIGPLGVAAPFATTILGWLALSDVKHSAGRLRGHGLARFCALLYPLLVLDLAILTTCGIVIQSLSLNQSYILWHSLGLAVAISLPVSIVIDFLIARRVWRATNPTARHNHFLPESELASRAPAKLALSPSHPVLTQVQFSAPGDSDVSTPHCVSLRGTRILLRFRKCWLPDFRAWPPMGGPLGD